MRYELFIGLRYLRAKRKEAFISLITIISMAGVMIGVMTLNIVLAVFTGFEEDLRDRILGFNPHIIVLSYSGAINDAERLMDRVKAVPGVRAAAPFTYGQVMIAHDQNVSGVIVRGILPESEDTVNVQRLLLEGDLEALGTRHPAPATDGSGGTTEVGGVILGKELATQLGVQVGDIISLISPIGTPTPLGLVPRVRRFAVVGRFASGMSEYDAGLIYMSLADAQQFFDLGSAVTGVEVRVGDVYEARPVAKQLSEILGFPYRVRDWMEINHNIFTALKLEKVVYFIVLLLIVLVAAFNIIATLIMVVMEKRKDIAILKSMGATASSVGRIFILKGLIVGLVGTLLGNVGGYIACWALGTYKFIDLPPDVFYVSTLPVKMYPHYFALVTLASLTICLFATIYPARQASRLLPVDVMRYE